MIITIEPEEGDPIQERYEWRGAFMVALVGEWTVGGILQMPFSHVGGIVDYSELYGYLQALSLRTQKDFLMEPLPPRGPKNPPGETP